MKVLKIDGERSCGDVKLTLWDDNAKVICIHWIKPISKTHVANGLPTSNLNKL